jgi:hypothetical protein
MARYYILLKNKTPEICLEAVKQNGLALEFVKEQTPEICLEAVKQDGLALEFVKERTPEICIEAVKQKMNYTAKDDKEQTSKMYLEIIDQNNFTLGNVNIPEYNSEFIE